MRRPVGIAIRPLGVMRVGRAIPASHAHRVELSVLRLPVWRSIVARPIVIRPIVLPFPVFLLLPRRWLSRRLTRRSRLLLPGLLRRPVFVLLRRTRQRQQRDACRCQQPFSELDSPLHFTLASFIITIRLVTSGDSSGRCRPPAPAAAIPSAHQNWKGRPGFPGQARQSPQSAAYCSGASLPKPLPLPASLRQSQRAERAGTPPTNSASLAAPPRARARANQMRPTVRSPAAHPANRSPREIHSRADGKPRK